MAPKVKEIIDIVDQIAPFKLAESWDNSGLQAGDPSWSVSKLLVALDVTPAAMEAAVKLGCDMLISHHPLIMSPEKVLDFSRMPGSVIYASANEQIAIVSAHTNLDKAKDGLNDYFAQALGVTCDGPFLSDPPSDTQEDGIEGLGRMGQFEQAITLEALAGLIKQHLDIPGVRVTGPLDSLVKSAALCTGSGGSLTSHFLKSSAEVYITGDLKYHEARDIEAGGKTAVDVGHFASEHIVVDLLTQRLDKEFAARGYKIETHGFNKEKDPFTII
ncbi:MAG: Nif3-like dinuclear metal center hexameric protein [Desulfobacterales bacterium]|nr:Nif3-like dinuclear metal center hexameric protein [Desulfobacterales bacterium]